MAPALIDFGQIGLDLQNLAASESFLMTPRSSMLQSRTIACVIKIALNISF